MFRSDGESLQRMMREKWAQKSRPTKRQVQFCLCQAVTRSSIHEQNYGVNELEVAASLCFLTVWCDEEVIGCLNMLTRTSEKIENI
jgi:hypothetical protein